MLAALTLAQACWVRASMSACVVVHRFCVLSPSVSRMMTLSRSAVGAAALFSGLHAVSA